jgi:hypothetical protein
MIWPGKGYARLDEVGLGRAIVCGTALARRTQRNETFNDQRMNVSAYVSFSATPYALPDDPFGDGKRDDPERGLISIKSVGICKPRNSIGVASASARPTRAQGIGDRG